MDAAYLQDRVYWGLNRVANKIGHITDAFRPVGTCDPLDQSNRYLRLKAAFGRADGNFAKAVGYGDPAWRGYFDASYTKVGDYLVQGTDIWFIVSQQSMLPVQCVKANKLISISRPAVPDTGASYGSGTAAPNEIVLARWPVTLLGIGSRDKPPAQLPGDTTLSAWTAYLPVIPDCTIRVSDFVTDASGGIGIVSAAESTDLGWRLDIRRLST